MNALRVYEVRRRYISEDVVHVEATTAREAIEASWGALDHVSQAVVASYTPKARLIDCTVSCSMKARNLLRRGGKK